jgi:hypothetical protein
MIVRPFNPPPGAALFALPTTSRHAARETLGQLLMLAEPPEIVGVLPTDDPARNLTLYLWFLRPQSEMGLALLGFDQARRLAGLEALRAGARLTLPVLTRVLGMHTAQAWSDA